MSFPSFALNANLLKAIHNMGFEHPTPIQRLAIPPLLEGRDVMATAVTGSGKTAAFLLPILHRLLEKPRGTTRALVLAPTRELAAQIAEHLHDLAVHTSLTGAAVYGGLSMGPQERAFRRGVDVLIATPGRLLDHFQYPYARLDGIEYLVLDEADRMLDMGFLPDIRRILKHVPKKRQTLLFSATLPAPIVKLARDMLHDPVSLNIERKPAPAAGITHVAYPVPHELKSNLFLDLLRNSASKNVLAFTRTKHRANRLADFLEKHGVACARIHGSRSQAQRTEALASFKKGRCRVLVATDIAARGIDVEALGLVVNFDVPNLPEDYIHRVGRTARMEATGDAYTFVSPNEEGNLRTIESNIGQRLPRQKVPGFDYAKKPAERFEVPIAERLTVIRARKSEERARAKEKAARRALRETQGRPAEYRNAGQNPRSTPQDHPARPNSWRGEPAWVRKKGQSSRGLAAGRPNGKADWPSNSSTTETRRAQRKENAPTQRDGKPEKSQGPRERKRAYF